MASEYEDIFKGTRDTVLAAKKKVHLHLEQLGRKELKDVCKLQMQLSLSYLRAISITCAKPDGIHCDIYCDIVVEVLSLYVKPDCGPRWTTYLEFLRYLHHLFIDKKMYTEAARICEHVSKFANALQNDADYKFILGMYTHHLICQINHMRIDASAAKSHISSTMDYLIDIFTKMLHCSNERNFQYPELIANFSKGLVPKRAQYVLHFIASLPEKKTEMYDAFFKLLAEQHHPELEKAELQTYFQRHLEALTTFIHLDASDRLQEQLALRHLRVCRELPFIKGDKSASYVFCLLYYLIKLCYGVPSNAEFTGVISDLSAKLAAFFEKFGDSLMQERWFTDVPVVISVLLTHMHQYPATPFCEFWRQMSNIECYISHLELVFACVKLTPKIVETKLMTIECCTSARKHTLISLIQSGLAGFSSYMQNVQTIDGVEDKPEMLISYRTSLLLVMRHGVSVFDSLICITQTSPEIKMLYARFIQFTCDVRTENQAKLCLALTEQLLRIRHKFNSNDWTVLLRRLYKMSVYIKDNKLTAELHAAYIAATLQESTWPDLNQLRNRVGIFYTTSSGVPCKTILQISEQSHNPFKVYLETYQKRLLHWVEVQHFIKFHKNFARLQVSLMECSQSLYDEVIVGRAANDLHRDVFHRLQKIKQQLQMKVHKPNGLSRLEHLMLGHIGTSFLHDKLKAQKRSIQTEIKCNEDNLAQLLQCNEFLRTTVANEITLIREASEVICSFKTFYDRADVEPIALDEAFIDWEAITDDLSSIALYLQLSGYLAEALEAWVLHYRVANTVNDQFNSLRGLAYFCENAALFESSVMTEINLQDELNSKQNFLMDAAEQLPTLPKRLQSYLLICLCHVAYYYARMENFTYAQILLNLVQRFHNELQDQQGYYNIVLGTLDIVRFRIMWKYYSSETNKQTNEFMKKSLLREMELILEKFRGECFKVTPSEVMSYTILLLNLVLQIGECAANRLCDYIVNSYFSSLFNMLLQTASALRIMQLLTIWAWIDLQMEFIEKAQEKLKLTEYIMGLKSLEELRKLSKETVSVKKANLPTLSPMEYLHSDVEPIRKVAEQQLSPIKTIEKIHLTSDDLKIFLCINRNEILQNNEILQWCQFTVGCLTARLFFLAENYEQLEEFYDSRDLWLKNRKSLLLSTSFENIKLMSMQHFANYLRLHSKHEKALNLLTFALDECKRIKSNVDNTYRINLLVQLYATRNEMSQLKDERKLLGLPRVLTFNVSPGLSQPVKDDKLSIMGSVKKVPNPTTSARKKSKPVIAIFGNENDSPKAIAPQSSKNRLNKQHEITDSLQKPTPAATPSVRKPMRVVFSEKKPLKQTTKTAFTPLSSGRTKTTTKNDNNNTSSSGSTPESDIETVLNYCQRIQSVDLADSDPEEKIPKLAKGSCRKKKTRREDIFNLCQRIESIDLRGSSSEDSPALTSAGNGNKITKPKKSAAQITEDIIKIMDDNNCMTPKSTLDKGTKAPKSINTIKSSKKATKSTPDRHKDNNGEDINKADKKNTSARSAYTEIGRVKRVEEIKITEQKTATTTSKGKMTRTEVRTLKVVTKKTAIEVVSPDHKEKDKSNKKDDESDSTKEASARKLRGRPRKANVQDLENMVTVEPMAVKSAKKTTTKHSTPNNF